MPKQKGQHIKCWPLASLQAGDALALLEQPGFGLLGLGQFGALLVDDFGRRLVDEAGIAELATNAKMHAQRVNAQESTIKTQERRQPLATLYCARVLGSLYSREVQGGRRYE